MRLQRHNDRGLVTKENNVPFPTNTEIILMRQWASYLATPIFIIDPQGNLIYFSQQPHS